MDLKDLKTKLGRIREDLENDLTDSINREVEFYQKKYSLSRDHIKSITIDKDPHYQKFKVNVTLVKFDFD